MSKEISAGTKLKRMWKKTDMSLTFKAWIRTLGDEPIVKIWKANKSGKNDDKRTESKKAKIAAERSASKLARKASKK
jgi:hypothetical protein